MDANSPWSIGRRWQKSSHADLHVGCCSLSPASHRPVSVVRTMLQLAKFIFDVVTSWSIVRSTWNRHRNNDTSGSSWCTASLSAMPLSLITVLMRFVWNLKIRNALMSVVFWVVLLLSQSDVFLGMSFNPRLLQRLWLLRYSVFMWSMSTWVWRWPWVILSSHIQLLASWWNPVEPSPPPVLCPIHTCTSTSTSPSACWFVRVASDSYSCNSYEWSVHVDFMSLI